MTMKGGGSSCYRPFSAGRAAPLNVMFNSRVEATAADPNRFTHTAHLRTPLGRFTHFSYDAKKHPRTIHPHHMDGVQVTGCSQHSIQIDVSGADNVALAQRWGAGWLFTMTPDHVPSGCPDARTGVVERRAPHYRKIGVISIDVTNTADPTPQQPESPPDDSANFHDMFESLDMTMHSTQMMHEDPSLVPPRRAPALGDKGTAAITLYQDEQRGPEGGPRPSLHFASSSGRPKRGEKARSQACKGGRQAACHARPRTLDKRLFLNWNYDKELGKRPSLCPFMDAPRAARVFTPMLATRSPSRSSTIISIRS